MKLCYLTHTRLPTEKAYGIQMANTVKAFSQVGYKTTLLTAKHKNSIVEDFFTYYNIEPALFSVRYFAIPNFFERSRFGFWLHLMLFSIVAMFSIIGRKYTTIYSREPFPLLFLAFLPYTTIYEMHDFPQSYHRVQSFLCRSVSKLVVTNEWAKTQCVERYNINPNKILVTPNGFDETKFNNSVSKDEARKSLGLPLQAKIVMYSGHLYAWKGVDVIAQVANELTDIMFMFVGGTEKEQKELKSRYNFKPNVTLIPHQAPHHVPLYLQAADILVLPNIPVNQHSEFSTSPIKLFEYMAVARPVIASQLPSITSLVSDEYVFFAEPGNVSDWKRVIKNVLIQENEVQKKVLNSLKKAQKFTWKSKAELIMLHIK